MCTCSKDSHEYVLNSGHSILYTWDKKMEKKAFVWWAEGEADKKRTTDLTEVFLMMMMMTVIVMTRKNSDGHKMHRNLKLILIISNSF